MTEVNTDDLDSIIILDEGMMENW